MFVELGKSQVSILVVNCMFSPLLFLFCWLECSGVEQTVEHQSMVAEETRAHFEGRPVEYVISSSKRKQLLEEQLQVYPYSSMHAHFVL